VSKTWPKVRLREVISRVERPETPAPGKEYRQIGVRLWGEGAYERETLDGAQTTYAKLFRAEAGDIIVNKIWARNGSVAVVPTPLAGCFASGEFPMFTPKSGKLDSQWLHWLTKTRDFWSQCDEKSQGTSGKNRIKPDQFLRVEIPLPPLSEQRRIVVRIEQLAAKIEEAKGLRKQAVEEVEEVLRSSIGALCCVEDYSKGVLGDVLNEAKNGIYKPPIFWGHGKPCIRMYNIDGPQMNTANLQYLDVSDEEWAVYSCKPGDLIFNRVNSAELVGKTGLITENYPPCTFESKNMRLRLDQTKALPEYIAVVLNSRATRDYYHASLKQQCGMATLNQGHVKDIPLQLPPLPEQLSIINYIDNLQTKVDILKCLQSDVAAELDSLLPSVLDKAFKGAL
jgi:type I restriction enzyme S subunit